MQQAYEIWNRGGKFSWTLNLLREASFKYLLQAKNEFKTETLYFQKNSKNFFFKRLQIFVWKKNLQKFSKFDFFHKHVYSSKIVKNNFFAWKWFHSKDQTILKSFSPWHFFHTTNIFCRRKAWNFQNYWFFENLKLFYSKKYWSYEKNTQDQNFLKLSDLLNETTFMLKKKLFLTMLEL